MRRFAFALSPRPRRGRLEPRSRHPHRTTAHELTRGAEGLCITRHTPKVIMAKNGLERTTILWLSRVATERNSLPPSPLEKVGPAIEQFVSFGSNPVILLDGVEYLIAHNDFAAVLALLHDLNELGGLHEAILLVPMDPSAFQERDRKGEAGGDRIDDRG